MSSEAATQPSGSRSLHRFANPGRFLRLADAVLPWVAAATILTLGAGIIWALFFTPPDYQQGQTVKIMYVHVPSAWMAMFAYTTVAAASAAALIWRHPVADIAAHAASPIGAGFTFLALATGSLWGKPMWGTWWVWDARLTSVLVLFFLYIGHMAIANAFEDAGRGRRAAAILALVGVINVPIIKFSVDWWNTLHQPATLSKLSAPSMTMDMLGWLLVMIVGHMLFFAAVVTLRLRGEVLLRERGARWIRGVDGRA